MQTAEIIADKLQCPVVRRKSLRDRNYGRLAGMERFSDEVNEIFSGLEKDRLNYRFPGGESHRDVQQRAVRGLTRIMNSATTDFGIVGHLDVNKIILAKLLGITFEE